MKKLDVLGQKVRVKMIKPKDETAGAVWIPEKKEIQIDPTEKDQYYYLIHELTHAWLDRAGFMHTSTGDNLQEIICHTNALIMSENAVILSQMFNKLTHKLKK